VRERPGAAVGHLPEPVPAAARLGVRLREGRLPQAAQAAPLKQEAAQERQALGAQRRPQR